MSATRIVNRFSRIALARCHDSALLFCRGDRRYVSTFSNQLICPHGQEKLLHRSMLHFSVIKPFRWLQFSSSSSPQVNEETTQSGNGLENKADLEPDLSRDDLVKLLTEKEQLLLSKQEELEKMKDKVLRTFADMENVKDRTRRESENAKKFAIQNFAKSLLDVADNMGRASFAANESFSKIDPSLDTSGAVQQLKILLEGVEMTEKQLSEVFKKFGLEKYEPADEEFDPNRHNAVFQVPSTSKPVNHVAVVLKAGYMLHDRVIRPAEVGVTVAINNEEAEIGSQS